MPQSIIRTPTCIVTLLALTIAACSDPDEIERARAGSRKPNVVVIVIDTLRADHLSQYGYRLDTSPGLEGFASEATRYEEAFSPAPWTKPSVGAVFSGLAPARHGAVGAFKPLSADVTTLAEILQAGGWDTAAFSNNPFVSPKTQFDQGFDEFFYMSREVHEAPSDDVEGGTRMERMLRQTEEMFASAWDWVRAREGAPFFIYLQPMNVHGPYLIPNENRDDLLGRRPIGGFEYHRGLMGEIMNDGRIDRRSAVKRRYWRSQREKYDTAIRYVTGVLARFFAYLKVSGIYDDTIIVVTSDHGEEIFDHGGFGHAYTLYDEVLRVPLMIKLPGQREAKVESRPVSTLDVLPTIAEAARLEISEGLDGRPLQRLASDATGDASDEFYFSTGWKRRCIARAVRSGDWKLIEIDKNYEYPAPRVLLFDLAVDPKEKRDIAGQHPDVVERLRRKLSDRFASYEAKGIEAPVSNDTMPDVEALRALGYVE